MYIQYLKKIIFEIFISFSEKLKNEKNTFLPFTLLPHGVKKKKAKIFHHQKIYLPSKNFF